jgi:hypothetical protein
LDFTNVCEAEKFVHTNDIHEHVGAVKVGLVPFVCDSSTVAGETC